jgi:hypothetical protein
LTEIIVKKTTSAIFLAIVLIVGTFASLSPSFMIGAHAQQYGMDQRYNSYEQNYGMDNSYDDKQSYGKDNSYPFKDSSSVSVKKIKCNNINVNLNGFSGNEIGTAPTSGLGALATEAQAEDEGEVGASSSGSDGGRTSGHDSDSRFVCINNNNNKVVEVDDGVTPPTPEEEECILCFTNEFITGPIEITEDFIMQFESIFDTEIDLVAGEELTLLELCRLFEEFSETMSQNRFVVLLEALNIIIPLTSEPFINCLIDAGIIVGSTG